MKRYTLTKHQREKFRGKLREQHENARMLCDKTDCFAVLYGYADYGKNNLLKRYELCLTPLDKERYDRLDAETRKNFPNRALFVIFERCEDD